MKLTTKQLRYLIKEELKKALSETSAMPTELEREIFKMFDAGKIAAYADTFDRTQSIDLAGEYVDKTDTQEFPNAHAWWVENYSTPDAIAKFEDWKKARHRSRR
jgi:hypothetical protein